MEKGKEIIKLLMEYGADPSLLEGDHRVRALQSIPEVKRLLTKPTSLLYLS